MVRRAKFELAAARRVQPALLVLRTRSASGTAAFAHPHIHIIFVAVGASTDAVKYAASAVENKILQSVINC
jgi:hypothetical protein